MKQKLRIPHDAYVLVGDGRKGLLLRNQGDELYPNLQVEREILAPANPLSHIQGDDRPPRAVVEGRRSALEQTDLHDRAEGNFAKDMASTLESVCRQKMAKAVILVAPPRMLAHLRGSLSDLVHRLVIAEIDKDLTKIPVHEIERHLTAN